MYRFGCDSSDDKGRPAVKPVGDADPGLRNRLERVLLLAQVVFGLGGPKASGETAMAVPAVPFGVPVVAEVEAIEVGNAHVSEVAVPR